MCITYICMQIYRDPSKKYIVFFEKYLFPPLKLKNGQSKTKIPYTFRLRFFTVLQKQTLIMALKDTSRIKGMLRHDIILWLLQRLSGRVMISLNAYCQNYSYGYSSSDGTYVTTVYKCLIHQGDASIRSLQCSECEVTVVL